MINWLVRTKDEKRLQATNTKHILPAMVHAFECDDEPWPQAYEAPDNAEKYHFSLIFSLCHRIQAKLSSLFPSPTEDVKFTLFQSEQQPEHVHHHVVGELMRTIARVQFIAGKKHSWNEKYCAKNLRQYSNMRTPYINFWLFCSCIVDLHAEKKFCHSRKYTELRKQRIWNILVCYLWHIWAF